jgi:hypothetical protein
VAWGSTSCGIDDVSGGAARDAGPASATTAVAIASLFLIAVSIRQQTRASRIWPRVATIPREFTVPR